MTTKEAAKYLGISLNYLRNLRQGQCRIEGPVCTCVKSRYGLAYDYDRQNLDTGRETTWVLLNNRKARRESSQSSLEQEDL